MNHADLTASTDVTTARATRQRALRDVAFGYPYRLVSLIAVALALAVLWSVQPLGHGLTWVASFVLVLATIAFVAVRGHVLHQTEEQHTALLDSLGPAVRDIPMALRARMPLVLVTGDGLTELFHRGVAARSIWVGDGAIWVRAGAPRELPTLAMAIRRWRDGRAPDGVLLSIAPALHPNEDAIAQNMRIAREALAEAGRLLGAPLPAYLAIYQRLARAGSDIADEAARPAPWFGVSADAPLQGAGHVGRCIERAEQAYMEIGAARAAAFASLVVWTQRTILDVLMDRKQPVSPWPLYGVAWIDAGPASDARSPWERHVGIHTRVLPAPAVASPVPWPLPQALIGAIPFRASRSPWSSALTHVIAMAACAMALASSGAARNNAALIAAIDADLTHFRSLPVERDTARRDALQRIVADRDELDRYARIGVPLYLGFGMYQGASLIAPLDTAIASYEPPPAPSAVVTLDSMSLFDSGKARLRDGSTRAMVAALDMIKANPGKRILVAGHTDQMGSATLNLRLSIERAGAVRDWLIDTSGMPSTQFAIQGYGDTRPVANNDTAEGRAQNRRVEITLISDDARHEAGTRATAAEKKK